MIITTSSSSDFTPAPAGSFLARCCRVVDLGTQKTEFQGETKQQHKGLVVFEILDPDVFRENGKTYTVAKRYSASMHEKAALRRDLESWSGAKFTDADLKHFDLASILGRTCLLSVTHTEKDGRVFANIAALVKAPGHDRHRPDRAAGSLRLGVTRLDRLRRLGRSLVFTVTSRNFSSMNFEGFKM